MNIICYPQQKLVACLPISQMRSSYTHLYPPTSDPHSWCRTADVTCGNLNTGVPEKLPSQILGINTACILKQLRETGGRSCPSESSCATHLSPSQDRVRALPMVTALKPHVTTNTFSTFAPPCLRSPLRSPPGALHCSIRSC